MKECIILAAGLMYLQGGVDCCRTSTDYLTNCVEPFMTYEMSDTFWTDICSPQGKVIFQCMKSQILNTSCPRSDPDVEITFRNIFVSTEYDLDVACELGLYPTCREVTKCFEDFVNLRVPQTPHVYQFWEFSCGFSYLKGLITCILSRQVTCPYTTEKQKSNFGYTTPQRTLSYGDIEVIATQKCGELTSADEDCIQANTLELDTCGTLPVVDLSAPLITCEYTDRTRSCLNDICGPRVSNFFIDTFNLLECSTFKACTDDPGTWSIMLAGDVVTLPCPSECSQVSTSEYCSSGEGLQPVHNNCTLKRNCSFLDVINNLLGPNYQATWEKTASETGTGIADIIQDLDEFLEDTLEEELISNQIPLNTVKVTSNDFLTVELGRTSDNIVFPAPSIPTSGQQDTSKASIEIAAESLTNLSAQGSVVYAGSYFDTLGETLDDDAFINGTFVQSRKVNTDVIGLLVLGQSFNFDPPIKVTFQLLKGKLPDPVCVFWDYSITSGGRKGAWSPEGCIVTNLTQTSVHCECDHLTNFAVLMSPSPDSDAGGVLSIISAVGCGISILCLLITIIVHLLVWRLVRSDRAVILMNICISLLFGLSIFLIGINLIESRPVCAAMAALIQFFFLAVFFLMLVMGIEILVCLVQVFGTKFRIKVLVPLAWASAAMVVGISLGVTEAEGYGNNKFCWLDVSSGLIWAFIGPVLFVILCNFIIIIVVLQKLAKVMRSKSKQLQLKAAARSLCVLMPLLGMTWVFGVLAINEDHVWMAYAFCVCNSLQGLFIFLMHCVFNTQIRDALKLRQKRKRSLQSFSSDFRKQSRSTSVERNRGRSDNSTGGPVKQGHRRHSLTEGGILDLRKKHRKARR